MSQLFLKPMKTTLEVALSVWFVLFLNGCRQPSDENTVPKPPDVESVVIIDREDLIPHRDGLFYNKQTNKPFTGLVNEFFPFKDSKQIRVSRHFKDGKQHGLRSQFYNDGKKFIDIFYKNGKKHGRATNWHRSGQITWERHFKEDQLDGDSIRYDTAGNVTQHVIYKMGRVEKAIK
jgi:antitoxin component YwqK of YwqJK toxin-antitoxin module